MTDIYQPYQNVAPLPPFPLSTKWFDCVPRSLLKSSHPDVNYWALHPHARDKNYPLGTDLLLPTFYLHSLAFNQFPPFSNPPFPTTSFPHFLIPLSSKDPLTPNISLATRPRFYFFLLGRAPEPKISPSILDPCPAVLSSDNAPPTQFFHPHFPTPSTKYLHLNILDAIPSL